MKCQKDINIPGNRESRKCYIYSGQKAVMIAQTYASAMVCHCNRHTTLLLELTLFLKRQNSCQEGLVSLYLIEAGDHTWCQNDQKY